MLECPNEEITTDGVKNKLLHGVKLEEKDEYNSNNALSYYTVNKSRRNYIEKITVVIHVKIIIIIEDMAVEE